MIGTRSPKKKAGHTLTRMAMFAKHRQGVQHIISSLPFTNLKETDKFVFTYTHILISNVHNVFTNFSQHCLVDKL